jgi:hypothetical protein
MEDLVKRVNNQEEFEFSGKFAGGCFSACFAGILGMVIGILIMPLFQNILPPIVLAIGISICSQIYFYFVTGKRHLKITPKTVFWESLMYKGNIAFAEIVELNFKIKTFKMKGAPVMTSIYYEILLNNGQKVKLPLNKWKTPKGMTSEEYLQTIIKTYSQ